MCIRTVIDVNLLGALAAEEPYPSFEKLLDWFDSGDGLIIYTDEEEFMRQMCAARVKWDWLVNRYRQSGGMERADATTVEKAREDIAAVPLRSGTTDIHLLALARAARVEVLCTDDIPLKSDFKNKKVLPRLSGRDRAVYPLPLQKDRDKDPSENMRKAESRFLAERKCPRRC